MKQAVSALGVLTLLVGGPVSVWAVSHYSATGIMDVIKTEILTPLTVFLFVLATVIFLWGVIEILAHPDNEEARSTGRKHMIWGIVGLFIMLSAVMIIRTICATFGISPCPS